MKDGQQPHWKFLVDSLPPTRQSYRILDFGCATGDLTEYLLGLSPAIMVTAIDTDHELVDSVYRKISKLSNSRASIICGNGFDLDASNYDMIYFNPPMVPNEPGFYGVDREWCLFHYFEWVSQSEASTALMLFDYCSNVRTSRGNQALENAVAASQLKMEEIRREARIVHDDSPIWIHQAEIKRTFPKLKFGSTTGGGQHHILRSIDRIAYSVEPRSERIKP